eukprot:923266-Rhodomonas_salina.1
MMTTEAHLTLHAHEPPLHPSGSSSTNENALSSPRSFIKTCRHAAADFARREPELRLRGGGGKPKKRDPTIADTRAGAGNLPHRRPARSLCDARC